MFLDYHNIYSSKYNYNIINLFCSNKIFQDYNHCILINYRIICNYLCSLYIQYLKHYNKNNHNIWNMWSCHCIFHNYQYMTYIHYLPYNILLYNMNKYYYLKYNNIHQDMILPKKWEFTNKQRSIKSFSYLILIILFFVNNF